MARTETKQCSVKPFLSFVQQKRVSYRNTKPLGLLIRLDSFVLRFYTKPLGLNRKLERFRISVRNPLFAVRNLRRSFTEHGLVSVPAIRSF